MKYTRSTKCTHFIPPRQSNWYLNMLMFYSACFWSNNFSRWDENAPHVILLTWSIYCATKRLPHSASLSPYHTELMALLLTSRTIWRRSNCFCTADVTAACHEVHTYINIGLSWKKTIWHYVNWCRKEKYILVQMFHVLSTTGLVNM